MAPSAISVLRASDEFKDRILALDHTLSTLKADPFENQVTPTRIFPVLPKIPNMFPRPPRLSRSRSKLGVEDDTKTYRS